jgi:hypothetical protein
MALPALLNAIRSQLGHVQWIHTLRAPATADQVQHLPHGLRCLYEITDGIGIHHIMYRGEIVGTALEVLPADEVIPIDHAMYGTNGQPRDWIGREWLAVARASDSAFYIALNPRQDQFYSVNPIVRDEVELIASSSAEYFAWLLSSLPSSEQLNVAAQQSAA